MIVAEESPSVQETIHMAFPESEFEISFFSDGEEVLKSVNQIKPDVFLLNLNLPGKDGYEVASVLNEEGQFHSAPLIFLQGAFEPLDEQRIAEINHETVVQEPFDSEKLVKQVRDALEKRKSPETLPEELGPGEESVSGWNQALEERIKGLIKKEIQEMENRIKTWIQDEIPSKDREKEGVHED